MARTWANFRGGSRGELRVLEHSPKQLIICQLTRISTSILTRPAQHIAIAKPPLRDNMWRAARLATYHGVHKFIVRFVENQVWAIILIKNDRARCTPKHPPTVKPGSAPVVIEFCFYNQIRDSQNIVIFVKLSFASYYWSGGSRAGGGHLLSPLPLFLRRSFRAVCSFTVTVYTTPPLRGARSSPPNYATQRV